MLHHLLCRLCGPQGADASGKPTADSFHRGRRLDPRREALLAADLSPRIRSNRAATIKAALVNLRLSLSIPGLRCGEASLIPLRIARPHVVAVGRPFLRPGLGCGERGAETGPPILTHGFR